MGEKRSDLGKALQKLRLSAGHTFPSNNVLRWQEALSTWRSGDEEMGTSDWKTHSNAELKGDSDGNMMIQTLIFNQHRGHCKHVSVFECVLCVLTRCSNIMRYGGGDT